jgi:hypothetical protein
MTPYNPTSPLTDDERRALITALDRAQHRPWIVASGEQAARNWLLGFGQDLAGVHWYLTTDRLHASEMKGSSAVADAMACALAVNAAPRLLVEVQDLRRRVEELRRMVGDLESRLHGDEDEVPA